ncbi:hypothetical protein Hsw_2308 [Hymenobacter swuensis DY53]|uniref:Transferrin-like domain-containing protein n=1 Tax=Hymenobacter swuensis DY53 TaxID=1227739 RepID=W8EZ55_9BACT|nr:hypothetical protein Hsw_2308 [Hymenobacter swuensis DY53]
MAQDIYQDFAVALEIYTLAALGAAFSPPIGIFYQVIHSLSYL